MSKQSIKAHIKRLYGVISWLKTLEQDKTTISQIEGLRRQIVALENDLKGL